MLLGTLGKGKKGEGRGKKRAGSSAVIHMASRYCQREEEEKRRTHAATCIYTCMTYARGEGKREEEEVKDKSQKFCLYLLRPAQRRGRKKKKEWANYGADNRPKKGKKKKETHKITNCSSAHWAAARVSWRKEKEKERKGGICDSAHRNL